MTARNRPLGWGWWTMATVFAGGTLTAMATTVLWLKNSLHNSYFLAAAHQGATLRVDLQDSLDRHVRDLSGMATGVSTDPDDSLESFRQYAVRVLRDNVGFDSILFVDKEFRPTWSFPFLPGARAVTPPGAIDAGRRAVATEKPSASRVVTLKENDPGVLFFAPVIRRLNWTGLLEGVLPTSRIARLWLDPALGDRFDYRLIDEAEGGDVLSSHRLAGTGSNDFDGYFTLSVADRTWWLILHPLHTPRVLLWVVMALFFEALAGTGMLYLWWRRSQQ